MTAQHILYQLSNIFLIIAFILPINVKEHKIEPFTKGCLLIGYLIQCFWSWNIVCSSVLFSWSFIFVIVNLAQLLYTSNITSPIDLGTELTRFYKKYFLPFKVNKFVFEKFVAKSSSYKLYKGELYGLGNFSYNDGISLLLKGRISVFDGKDFLYHIYPMEFIDSFAYSANKCMANERIQFSFFATQSHTEYVHWDHKTLQLFLAEYNEFRNVFNLVISQDILGKLQNVIIQQQKGTSNTPLLDLPKELRMKHLTTALLLNNSAKISPNKLYRTKIKLIHNAAFNYFCQQKFVSKGDKDFITNPADANIGPATEFTYADLLEMRKTLRLVTYCRTNLIANAEFI